MAKNTWREPVKELREREWMNARLGKRDLEKEHSESYDGEVKLQLQLQCYYSSSSHSLCRACYVIVMGSRRVHRSARFCHVRDRFGKLEIRWRSSDSHHSFFLHSSSPRRRWMRLSRFTGTAVNFDPPWVRVLS